MKKIIAILLILIGAGVCFTPFIMDQIIQYKSKLILDELLSQGPLAKAHENNQSQVEFDYSVISDVDLISIIEGTKELDKNLVRGSIVIPDLEISLPIMEGCTNANLLVGAATMKPGQVFGFGNYTLSGHKMKNKKLLFGALMDIEIGSRVYLSDGQKTYQYEVYETIVVPDTAMDILSDERSQEKGKAILSLMTCYHSSQTGKRFFALAELVDQDLGQEKSEKMPRQ